MCAPHRSTSRAGARRDLGSSSPLPGRDPRTSTPACLDFIRRSEEHLSGTLGILHLAKVAALIQAVRPEIERLRAAGIHIDSELAREFLQRIGE
jgi:hypothetical protein